MYRLYREEEFLEGVSDPGSLPAAAASDRGAAGAADVRMPAGQWLRRLAGAAMLAGALGAAGWLIALSTGRSIRGAGPKTVDGPRAAVRDRLRTASGPPLRRRAGAADSRLRSPARQWRGLTRSRRSPSHEVTSRPFTVVTAPSVAPAPRSEFGFERGAGT